MKLREASNWPKDTQLRKAKLGARLSEPQILHPPLYTYGGYLGVRQGYPPAGTITGERGDRPPLEHSGILTHERK